MERTPKEIRKMINLKGRLKQPAYCGGCPFLVFDKENSRENECIGEGYYAHYCVLYDYEPLIHYLHHPLRLEDCKRDHLEVE